MTGSVSGAQLRAFIERIERLEEEKRTIADDIKEVKAEAKGCGFDLPTINAILENSIAALGFQISFYLGLTGFACAWHFRKKAGATWEAVTHVYWPAVSAAFLFFVAAYSANGFDLMTNVIGWGGIAIGIIPLVLNRLRARKG